jgi:putative serine protease PepD
VYGTTLEARPGPRSPGVTAAVANAKGVVTLEFVSSGGEEHDDDMRGGSDDDGPDLPRGALPDRLDRIWLHPSELSPLAAASTTTTRTRPMWATTLVAGAAGAILTLAVLGAIGALNRSSDHTADPGVVPTSAPIPSPQAVAIAVAHSVVAVSAHAPDGTRRGSGVCVRQSGEILTSDRLVGDATKVDVTTSDGVVHPARILGRDSTTDLVLLSVATGSGPAPGTQTQPALTVAKAVPAPFSSSTPQAGDTVWIVGAPGPGDSSPWMSSGLVSSTDGLVAVSSGPTTSGLLETAAASSSASSGGALVNRAGDVTGIVLAPVGDDRMTYAVPIATALAIANDLRSHGYAEHGALGINGIDAADGPTVTNVIEGGPAARAGVHVGDVVESVDNHEVYSMDDVMALVRHDQPGQPVVVELQRGTRTITVSAKLTSMISP